jgi:hypothetical protein
LGGDSSSASLSTFLQSFSSSLASASSQGNLVNTAA